ncbi:MAG: tyrosine-type recombinase/integrase [Planctomycetota bacterium]
MMADDLIKTRISGDFTTHWIFDLYELGTAVSLIAHKVKLTEQRVYEKMRQHPETYEEVKAAGTETDLVPRWTPYQLRHTAATKVRKEMGYECAGATLGHTNMSATAIYAERNQGLADEAAKRFG